MMSDIQLPSEWRETTLECVGVVVTGKTPSKKNPDFFSGTIPFIKPGDVNDQGVITHTEEHLTDLGAATVPTIPLGAVVVTCIGNLGRCAITSELSATNQQINSVIPDSGVNVSFIYYQLRTLKEWMLSESSATTVTIINKSKFSQAPIVLPPLAEQKVIADKLDTLLAQAETTKARLERIPEILKRFRQSVLAAAVSGKLTEEWREGRGITWQSLTIEDIGEVKGGKRLPKGDELLEENTGYPYIRAGQLKLGTVISTDDARSKQLFLKPETQKKISRYTVNSGDLYLTIVGASIGDAGVIPANYDKANLTENAAKITDFKRPINSEFVSYWLRSHQLQDLIKLEIKSGAQGKLALKRIKDLPVPYTDIEEQTEIVSRVEELFAFADCIEQKATAALSRVNNLTQSILAKAFRGELTAEWRAANPELISGDNSAAALLEKIKAERQAMKPVKKTRAKTAG